MKKQNKIISEPAPILLFVHKRIATLKKVIKSLKKMISFIDRNYLFFQTVQK